MILRGCFRVGTQRGYKRKYIKRKGNREGHSQFRNCDFFRRTNKTSENETDADEMGENVNFIAANIFTDCDTLYDADESGYSESDISEDEENGKHFKDTSVSNSSEDILMDDCSIISEHFYT